MAQAAAAVLALVCIVLAVRLVTAERSLRAAAEHLRRRRMDGSGERIYLKTPNSSVEVLLEEVNALLEDREAEEADYQARERALRQQISNVSHDLRTPLTSILGYLQLLEREDLPAQERREYLAVVTGRARALQELIGSFYDLSRLESGEFGLKRERVDLYDVLSAQLAAFYSDLESAGFGTQVELSENLPPVWGDGAGVLRIFSNLIRNALDHGSGQLEIRLYQDKNEIVSSFTNDAGELTQAEAAHVFDRFFTSDRNRTGRNTGLGLAIVKALAGQMGHRCAAFVRDGRFTVLVRWTVSGRQETAGQPFVHSSQKEGGQRRPAG